MEYLILTTKHHDGFCLFETQQTDYNFMNTPYGKDIVAILAESCHRRGMTLGLYYSVPDWHHPNSPNQGRHHELEPQPNDQPDPKKYRDFIKVQTKELCTNYGPIHSFWWDLGGHIREDFGGEDKSINDMIRSLQPNCIINPRGLDDGDFSTPEREFDQDQASLPLLPIEACNSVGMESRGYRESESYYSDRHIMRAMATTFAIGGNYLFNIGPKPDGTIPEKSSSILERLSQWLEATKESFFDVESAQNFSQGTGLLCTRRNMTYYIIVQFELPGEDIHLPAVLSLPSKATLLNTGQEIVTSNTKTPSRWRRSHGCLRICGLPINELSGEVMVIRLEFDEELKWDSDQTKSDQKMIM
jgi:alpha-L-fucosidase